jgi:hypothetical protein
MVRMIPRGPKHSKQDADHKRAKSNPVFKKKKRPAP